MSGRVKGGIYDVCVRARRIGGEKRNIGFNGVKENAIIKEVGRQNKEAGPVGKAIRAVEAPWVCRKEVVYTSACLKLPDSLQQALFPSPSSICIFFSSKGCLFLLQSKEEKVGVYT